MESPSTYALSAWFFLRLLGLIYVIAFASLALQVRGLAGRSGIAPARRLRVQGVRASLRAFARVPTLCRWSASDASLLIQCWGGAALGAALMFGIAPVAVLLALWILYLSLTNACGIFLGYQWDALLAEMGLLAVLLAPPWAWYPDASYEPPLAARVVLVWLLFRLVFSSGAAKLRSGDPTWRRLAALRHHFETQPLPNTPSWYAHHVPAPVHTAATFAMFAIELGAPLLLWLEPPVSYAGAIAIVALMIAIEASGNYGFFNLQTAALCVLVFPDHAFPTFLHHTVAEGPRNASIAWQVFVTGAALSSFTLSLFSMVRLFTSDAAASPALQTLFRAIAPYRVVNSYGLFAVMTTSRPEIVVEGSHDGHEWRAYEFKWKPGDPRVAPRTVAPHQPRLDWQMWFAALGSVSTNAWFVGFAERLLEGSREVVGLLRSNPFAAEPPRYVRAVLYDYRFTTPEERFRTGTWWNRELLGLYCPPIERFDARNAQPSGPIEPAAAGASFLSTAPGGE